MTSEFLTPERERERERGFKPQTRRAQDIAVCSATRDPIRLFVHHALPPGRGRGRAEPRASEMETCNASTKVDEEEEEEELPRNLAKVFFLLFSVVQE